MTAQTTCEDDGRNQSGHTRMMPAHSVPDRSQGGESCYFPATSSRQDDPIPMSA